MEKILEDASQKAGIAKHVTVHTSHHSFATHLLEGVQIYGIFKSCLVIRVRKLQKSILTLASGILDELKALWILGRNDNNKKLRLEASFKVLHKRSTSQNMSFWEHKRSSSIIYSYAQSPALDLKMFNEGTINV